MRSQKRYANTTFTHRTDHEAGRHRPPRAPSEPRVCRTCGAVYRKRRWVTADEAGPVPPRAADGTPAAVVTCPACRKIAAKVPNGFVYFGGTFAQAHREEIVRLVQAEARRAAVDNPTAQLIAWERTDDGRLAVSTTTEHLAERLGQAVAKAYDGDVRYDFSHENKFARVHWHRD